MVEEHRIYSRKRALDLYKKTAFSLYMGCIRHLSIIIIILLIPLAGGERETDLEYIAHPGNIPNFSNFTTPQMVPGDTGVLNLSFTNRYDMAITQVNVTIEIYFYANIHESKNLSRVDRVPYFISSGTQTTYKIWNSVESEEKKTDAIFRIHTSEGTEQGTYFVRFTLRFQYNSSSYLMRSRGYFSDEQWDNATTNTTKEDPGNINITKLGVDGIIPDTTFGVKKPFPLWPMYVLAALTVMFAALAILTYMYEENSNPGFNRWVHKNQRKLGEYHALMFHEFGKFRKKEKR